MSTGTFLIQQALKNIGAHSLVRSANPVSIEDGFNTLNSMLQLWISQGIDLGIVPIEAPGAEVSEPSDATQVIIDNLAVLLSSAREGGNEVVSESLRKNAEKGFNVIKNLYQVFTIPEKLMSSTTPRGAGNRARELSFFGRGRTLGS